MKILSKLHWAVNGVLFLGICTFVYFTRSDLVLDNARNTQSQPVQPVQSEQPAQSAVAANWTEEPIGTASASASAPIEPAVTTTVEPAKSTVVSKVMINGKPYKYVGESSDGLAHGQGTAYRANGQKRYEGEFLHGQPTFVGKEYFESGKLMAAGTRNGTLVEVIEYNEDGTVYSRSSFENNSKKGTAEIYYPDGSLQYKGDMTTDKFRPDGQGVEYYSNGGKRYVGSFVDGAFQGHGEFYDENSNLLYMGQFENGMLDAEGKFYDNGTILYDGEHDQGIYNGKGKLYIDGKLAYDGDFVNGVPNGQGKLYDYTTDGQLIYDGEFIDAKPTGNGKTYSNSKVEISITIRNQGNNGSSGGSFNMPDGIKIVR